MTATIAVACTAPFSLPIAGAIVALSVLQGLSLYIFAKILDTNNLLLLQTAAAITSIALGAFCLPLLGSTLSLQALVIITPKMIAALGACHLALRALYTSLHAVLKHKALAPSPAKTSNPTLLKKIQSSADAGKMQTVKKAALITAIALVTAATVYVGWSYFSSNPTPSVALKDSIKPPSTPPPSPTSTKSSSTTIPSTATSSTLQTTPSILSSNSSTPSLSHTSSFTWTPFMYGSIFLSIALGISLFYKKREKELSASPPTQPGTAFNLTHSAPFPTKKPESISSVPTSTLASQEACLNGSPHKNPLIPTVIGSFRIFNEETQTLEEYEQLQTMGDGACGLHAILGKPVLIHQEITIGYVETEEESASKAVRALFAQELQKAFETRMDSLQDSWEKMLLGLVKEYIKDQDPSKELYNLLGSIHGNLLNLKKEIQEIQLQRQRLVTHMHALLEEAKKGPLIQALLAAHPTNQLANLVQEAFENRIAIIAQDSPDLAIRLRDNINRRIALAEKEEEIVTRFCNSDVAKKGYLKGITHIDYRLNREEVCFAGEVLHKRVSVCSRAGPLEIDILQGKGAMNNSSVVVFYENGHFSLCQRKEDVAVN